MRRAYLLLFILITPHVVWANVASVQYVHESVSSKVDTSQSANQTMAGTYTVSGSFKVPTPPLPPTE